MIARASQHQQSLSSEMIQQVVAANDKQRFALSEDGRYIRANQRHSIAVNLDLQPVMPPPILFDGTATRFLRSIMAEGLIP